MLMPDAVSKVNFPFHRLENECQNQEQVGHGDSFMHGLLRAMNLEWRVARPLDRWKHRLLPCRNWQAGYSSARAEKCCFLASIRRLSGSKGTLRPPRMPKSVLSQSQVAKWTLAR
jgi:hypothetical protein